MCRYQDDIDIRANRDIVHREERQVVAFKGVITLSSQSTPRTPATSSGPTNETSPFDEAESREGMLILQI